MVPGTWSIESIIPIYIGLPPSWVVYPLCCKLCEYYIRATIRTLSTYPLRHHDSPGQRGKRGASSCTGKRRVGRPALPSQASTLPAWPPGAKAKVGKEGFVVRGEGPRACLPSTKYLLVTLCAQLSSKLFLLRCVRYLRRSFTPSLISFFCRDARPNRKSLRNRQLTTKRVSNFTVLESIYQVPEMRI